MFVSEVRRGRRGSVRLCRRHRPLGFIGVTEKHGASSHSLPSDRALDGASALSPFTWLSRLRRWHRHGCHFRHDLGSHLSLGGRRHCCHSCQNHGFFTFPKGSIPTVADVSLLVSVDVSNHGKRGGGDGGTRPTIGTEEYAVRERSGGGSDT